MVWGHHVSQAPRNQRAEAAARALPRRLTGTSDPLLRRHAAGCDGLGHLKISRSIPRIYTVDSVTG